MSSPSRHGFLQGFTVHIIGLFMLISFISVSTAAQKERIRACYFTGGKHMNFSGSAVDPFVCTHIILASGVVTREGVTTGHPVDMEQYKDVAALKEKNNELKVMVSLQSGFASVVDQPFESVIERFALNAVIFLEKLNMDGFDIDWEFPALYEKETCIRFIKILASYLHVSNLKLSMALPASPFRIENGFDLETINQYMDFVTIMNYDYHGYNDNNKITGYNSPLYTPKGENIYLSTAESLTYFLEKGLSKDKMLMGIPTYGRSWNLTDPKVHGLHSPANGLGLPGPYAKSPGVYLYADTCMAVKQGATAVMDVENVGQYLYHGSTWVAYDSNFTITKKVKWLIERDLAGVGVWAYQLDDIYNACGYGDVPLLRLLKKLLQPHSLYFSPEQ